MSSRCSLDVSVCSPSPSESAYRAARVLDVVFLAECVLGSVDPQPSTPVQVDRFPCARSCWDRRTHSFIDKEPVLWRYHCWMYEVVISPYVGVGFVT